MAAYSRLNYPVCGIRGRVVAEAQLGFAAVLRGLRTGAGLTQEELAESAGLTSRAISYLERGEVSSPRRETVRLLADALRLAGPARAQFEAAARGRTAPGEAGPDEMASASRTLPRDVASFTGRQQELAELAEAAASAGSVVSIHAIGGMAGIGKTAFAVHAAHRLAGQFPGGQIFVPLHGHTPGQRPADPADVLARLLETVGVSASQTPAGLEARMALWRDRAAQRQLLLILDDATGSDQVIPLLPGSGGSLVLVTSRRHLSALEDATPISLDTLPPDQAGVLLARLAGRAGLNPEDPAVAELTRLCGFLPLAIGMVARQLRHHPAWTVAGRAADLAAAADRLAVMATENVSVAAAFDLSYAALTDGQQRLFRRLGLHLGAEVDSYAAAALDNTGLAAARRGLEDLYDQYLLTEPVPGRYRLHDLIREHARALALRLDPSDDRDAAITRLLDYYQRATARANALFSRHARPLPAMVDESAIQPEVPELAGPEQALAWARAERANLLASVDHAVSNGEHARVVALTAALSGLLLHDGPWPDALARFSAAITAAQTLGDRLSQARALYELGSVMHLTGDFPAAAQAQEQALGIYRDLCDREGEADSLRALGVIQLVTGEFRAAARSLERALVIYRETGDRRGQADALDSLGNVLRVQGDYAAAARAHEQALVIYRDTGNEIGEANVLNALGIVLRLAGDLQAAVTAHEQALAIYRQTGSLLGQANSLDSLGVLLRLTGEFTAAAQAHEEALASYRATGSPYGPADALCHLGSALRLAGDLQAAAQALKQALDIYRQIGSPAGEAEAVNEIGVLHLVTGELVLAERCHQQALETARGIDSSWDEAHALLGLGHCAVSDGRVAEGEARLRQALAIFERVDSAEAVRVASELDALTEQQHGHRTG
jgi:tetratricopeptide (TPR) repeat protein/transcriptional regulator with XRE-family HTH domain